jgi:hypothetical protein
MQPGILRISGGAGLLAALPTFMINKTGYLCLAG